MPRRPAPAADATPKPVPIIALPGLGPRTAAWLAGLGLHTADDLRAADPFALYAQLLAQVPGTSLNLLYALIGAVEGRDWRAVARDRRTEVLMRLDDMGLAPGSAGHAAAQRAARPAAAPPARPARKAPGR